MYDTRYTGLKIAAKCAALLLAFAWLHACSSGEDTRSSDPPTPPPPPPTSEPTGLDTRPSNTTCLAWDRPSADDTISLTRYTNLSFASPVAMLQAPNDNSRWFVVEQGGAVFKFAVSNPVKQSFIDISARVDDGGEMGLLGMAFHPDFPQDPRVFLSYTNEDSGRVSRISSFRTVDSGATLDPGTEQTLMTVSQPETNHKGGNIAFGPDRLLYIGFGDGGSGGDPHGNPGNGQRLTTLLGKMLRIDVGSNPNATTYTVPAGNPFFNAGNAGDKCLAPGNRASGTCPEIFAYGFRNPWRWSFDRVNGDLWVGDVGQGMWEEVDLVTAGANYGWRCREGAHDFNSAATTGCNTATLIDPVTEYDHSDGFSVTGGYVYRGTQTTNLVGRYVFADFSGRMWAWIPESAPSPREPTHLLDSGLGISSFGQANDGELYVVNHTGGTLHHIEFEAGPVSGNVPTNLSETGCVVANNAQQPATGLIPYAINAPFWSDGANKERWIALPNGQSATVRTDGDWDFPNRSVLMKSFRVGTRLIETRLLMRHPDGTWGGFTYEWNAQQTDAALVEGGANRDIGNGQIWRFPSEDDCLVCHTDAANRALGLETAQLNRTLTYTQTGRTANELITLSHIGLLSPPITVSATQPAMPDPADTTATLGNRARAYLHTNCSQCHRPNGPTSSTMDLRYSTALNMTNACNASPTAGDLGIGANARLIAPGSAANSIVVARANLRDSNGMPPLGSNQVDTDGVALLTQWINGLTGC